MTTYSIDTMKRLLSLLVAIICFAKASANDDAGILHRTRTSPICNDNESPFHVELKTDDFPDSTSWELIDVVNNDQQTVVYSVEQGKYSQSNSLNEEIFCILSDSLMLQIHHSRFR